MESMQPGFFWNDRHLQVCHITPRGEGHIEASELSISTLAKISTENVGGILGSHQRTEKKNSDYTKVEGN